MSFNVKHEEITPSTAQSYLSKSIGNRRLNSDYVLSLAVAMETGKWNAEASEVVFDETGALIDGHHRLHAIVAYEKPVTMLVKRGVSKTARSVIDTGRTRSIADLFTMFRPDSPYINQRRATIVSCVALVSAGEKNPPAIRTLDSFDAWSRVFSPGVDAIIEIVGPMSGAPKGFRTGPVLGAFAFAHKTSPKKVEAFLLRSIEGLGLERNEPATTLRSLMVRGGGRQSGGDRIRVSRKVLGGIYSSLKGQSWTKAQDGRMALDFFRKAYDEKQMDKMVDLWALDALPSVVQ